MTKWHCDACDFSFRCAKPDHLLASPRCPSCGANGPVNRVRTEWDESKRDALEQLERVAEQICRPEATRAAARAGIAEIEQLRDIIGKKRYGEHMHGIDVCAYCAEGDIARVELPKAEAEIVRLRADRDAAVRLAREVSDARDQLAGQRQRLRQEIDRLRASRVRLGNMWRGWEKMGENGRRGIRFLNHCAVELRRELERSDAETGRTVGAQEARQLALEGGDS